MDLPINDKELAAKSPVQIESIDKILKINEEIRDVNKEIKELETKLQ